jgi:hypothetical protein
LFGSPDPGSASRQSTVTMSPGLILARSTIREKTLPDHQPSPQDARPGS